MEYFSLSRVALSERLIHRINRPSSGSQMLKSPKIMPTQKGYAGQCGVSKTQSATSLPKGMFRFKMDVNNNKVVSPRLNVHKVITPWQVTKCVTVASSGRTSLWMQTADPPAFFVFRNKGTKESKSRSQHLCKDNTSKDPFSKCELYKEFWYRSKLSTRVQRQEIHWRREAQDRHIARDRTQQCVQWLKTLGEHVSASVVVAVFVVSLCFAVLTLISCTSHCGSRCSRLSLIPSHGHHMLSVSLFDLSICFIFLLFIIFGFQHFLLRFTFPEVK